MPIPTPHITAKEGDFAKTVLMPGDPLRAKFIAENYLENAVLAIGGKPVASYFRAPEGSFSRSMLQKIHSMGYRTVFWSIAYADWDNQHQPNEEKALSLLLGRMHNGAVILLHPTSATNAAILPRLIEALQKEGYRFGTLDELCLER